jgi:hypothetical protein
MAWRVNRSVLITVIIHTLSTAPKLAFLLTGLLEPVNMNQYSIISKIISGL